MKSPLSGLQDIRIKLWICTPRRCERSQQDRDCLLSFLIDYLHLSIEGESGQNHASRPVPFFYSSIDITWISACMYVVCLLGRWITFLLFIYFSVWPLYLSLSMTLLRLNRLLLRHLIAAKPTRLIAPASVSAIPVRCATEIRSRRPVQSNANTKQRKNTVNPITQVKKLGAKAGKWNFP